ncbi:MAG TPA: CDP-alcohol phosphatidyltransferase family protein [Roseomonas sp.]|jgi:hypothetical protein
MSANTIIHRIVHPAVVALAPTGVTPNQITTIRLATGIAAALAFAGPAPWLHIGAGIFVVSMLLDRMDGDLARFTGQTSPRGHIYDLISDCVSNIIAFIGIGIGLMPEIGFYGPLLGILAGCGIGALFGQLHILRLGELKPWVLGPGLHVDPDDLMIFMPILVWIGAAIPMLIAAAVITPILAILLGLTGKKRAV